MEDGHGLGNWLVFSLPPVLEPARDLSLRAGGCALSASWAEAGENCLVIMTGHATQVYPLTWGCCKRLPEQRGSSGVGEGGPGRHPVP